MPDNEVEAIEPVNGEQAGTSLAERMSRLETMIQQLVTASVTSPRDQPLMGPAGSPAGTGINITILLHVSGVYSGYSVGIGGRCPRM